MPKSESLGQFEQLVLAAIAGLEDNAYGVTIHTRVEQLSGGRKVTLAAVYVTLDRLEHKGLVSSRLSAPTAERGGRSKRCYTLVAAGERALKEAVATARRMDDSLRAVWGVAENGWESA
ncbi:MAG: PadR family transcriptional regulator [Bryobacteraceae bacterium]